MRTAASLIADHDALSDTFTVKGAISRAGVMAEICRHLVPYAVGEKPITGGTVISKDLAIDSLAVMDMVMELEDCFDVSIPLSVVAEIHTVDQLADTILALRAKN